MIKDNKKLKESIGYIHFYMKEALGEVKSGDEIDMNNLSDKTLRTVLLVEGMANINALRILLEGNVEALASFGNAAEQIIDMGIGSKGTWE